MIRFIYKARCKSRQSVCDVQNHFIQSFGGGKGDYGVENTCTCGEGKERVDVPHGGLVSEGRGKEFTFRKCVPFPVD